MIGLPASSPERTARACAALAAAWLALAMSMSNASGADSTNPQREAAMKGSEPAFQELVRRVEATVPAIRRDPMDAWDLCFRERRNAGSVASQAPRRG